jgi:hypothetical protein
MRTLSFVLVLLLTACAHEPAQQGQYECTIWEATDKPTDGLIHVNEPLFSALQSLVPAGRFESPHVCWYQKTSGHIEAYPWDGGYWVGYEFDLGPAGWKFVSRNEYVVLFHSRGRRK